MNQDPRMIKEQLIDATRLSEGEHEELLRLGILSKEGVMQPSPILNGRLTCPQYIKLIILLKRIFNINSPLYQNTPRVGDIFK